MINACSIFVDLSRSPAFLIGNANRSWRFQIGATVEIPRASCRQERETRSMVFAG
jgi:hypothetical protein